MPRSHRGTKVTYNTGMCRGCFSEEVVLKFCLKDE
jgi:hypothetical protein